MIKFSVSRLDKEPIELCGSEDKDFISLPEGDDYTVISPLEYQLNVMKVSGGALVTGRCSTEISGICGRCLDDVVCELAAEDIELFIDLENCGEEVLRVKSNEIALPVVDDEGEERWLMLTFKVPTGERGGDGYDGYSMAEDYQMNLAKKAAKAAENEAKTAKNKAKAKAKAEAE